MSAFYVTLCAEQNWPVDDAFLAQMTAVNGETLAKLEAAVKGRSEEEKEEKEENADNEEE